MQTANWRPRDLSRDLACLKKFQPHALRLFSLLSFSCPLYIHPCLHRHEGELERAPKTYNPTHTPTHLREQRGRSSQAEEEEEEARGARELSLRMKRQRQIERERQKKDRKRKGKTKKRREGDADSQLVGQTGDPKRERRGSEKKRKKSCGGKKREGPEDQQGRPWEIHKRSALALSLY